MTNPEYPLYMLDASIRRHEHLLALMEARWREHESGKYPLENPPWERMQLEAARMDLAEEKQRRKERENGRNI